jgi:hypothetical protein
MANYSRTKESRRNEKESRRNEKESRRNKRNHTDFAKKITITQKTTLFWALLW